jgi:carbon-monoxide dehydrogenase medium subunit
MKAAAFDYKRPDDVAAALKELAAGKGQAKAFGGGQSLGPMLNLRLARPQ